MSTLLCLGLAYNENNECNLEIWSLLNIGFLVAIYLPKTALKSFYSINFLDII